MVKESDKFIDSNIFEGMTSISAIIKANLSGITSRSIVKILFDKTKIDSKRRELDFLKHQAALLGFEIELCNEDIINTYTIGNSHGGIIAICGDRIIQNLFESQISPNGVYYLLEGVEDPYNFGNSIRSLYASGADGIIVGSRNWMGAAGVVARSSAGTSELINMYMADDTVEVVKHFKALGYTVVCAGIRDSIDIFDAELKKPLLVIIGGEKRGISRKVLEMSDQIVRIQYEKEFRGSLSTSATSAIIGFEISRKNR